VKKRSLHSSSGNSLLCTHQHNHCQKTPPKHFIITVFFFFFLVCVTFKLLSRFSSHIKQDRLKKLWSYRHGILACNAQLLVIQKESHFIALKNFVPSYKFVVIFLWGKEKFLSRHAQTPGSSCFSPRKWWMHLVLLSYFRCAVLCWVYRIT
jgi:hypothetical protein